MIYVIAVVTAKAGKREEYLAAYRDNVANVRAEPGCLEYGPLVDAEDGFGAKFEPGTFVVIGKWQSLEHQRAHAAMRPHMVTFTEKTRDLLDHREIYVLSPAL